MSTPRFPREAFLDAVAQRAGLVGEAAEAVTDATLAALGELLVHSDRAELGCHLSPDLAAALRMREPGSAFDAEDLYARVAVAEGTDAGFAREHVQAVLAELADHLNHTWLVYLRERVPDDIAALLEPPEHPAPAPERHAIHGAADQRRLSAARPDSAHPISEAHGAEQEDSVADPNPHGERKLSSGHEDEPDWADQGE